MTHNINILIMRITKYFTSKQAEAMHLSGGEGWYQFNAEEIRPVEPPKETTGGSEESKRFVYLDFPGEI